MACYGGIYVSWASLELKERHLVLLKALSWEADDFWHQIARQTTPRLKSGIMEHTLK
jgi:hypothetical protein